MNKLLSDFYYGRFLGPVVQSIISLTSLLRGRLVKCFATLYPKTQKFLVEKLREAFAIFSAKFFCISEKLTSENLTRR